MDIKQFCRHRTLRGWLRLCHWKPLNLVIIMFMGLLIFHCSYGDEFETSDERCSAYDKCGAPEYFRTCSCDRDCFRYGTCCWDAPKMNYSDIIEEELFQCYGERNRRPVFAKQTCSQSFQGDAIIINRCKTPETTDLMSQVLVTSNRTLTTYFNWNCAICNNENATDIVFWTVQATCSKPSRGKSVEASKVRRELKYHDDQDQWGVLTKDEFLACPLTFYEPPLLMGFFSYCTPSIVSECPDDWKDYKIRHNCVSYHAERKDKNTGVRYKNEYCANCNGFSASRLECIGRNSWRVKHNSEPVFGTMKLIFNLNPWSGEYIRKEQFRCSEGRIFDPFLKTCRSHNCGLVNPTEDKDFCNASGSIKNVVPYWYTFGAMFTLMMAYTAMPWN